MCGSSALCRLRRLAASSRLDGSWKVFVRQPSSYLRSSPRIHSRLVLNSGCVLLRFCALKHANGPLTLENLAGGDVALTAEEKQAVERIIQEHLVKGRLLLAAALCRFEVRRAGRRHACPLAMGGPSWG